MEKVFHVSHQMVVFWQFMFLARLPLGPSNLLRIPCNRCIECYCTKVLENDSKLGDDVLHRAVFELRV